MTLNQIVEKMVQDLENLKMDITADSADRVDEAQAALRGLIDNIRFS